jgi:hypothetical protein
MIKIWDANPAPTKIFGNFPGTQDTNPNQSYKFWSKPTSNFPLAFITG